MSRFMLVLLVISLSACGPQPIPPPTPTNVIHPTQSPQIPVPSDWAGAITHADKTSESILVHLAETDGTFNVEPQTKTYPLNDVHNSGSAISFKINLEEEMSFSGKFDGAQITGQVAGNRPTDSFTLTLLSSAANDSLEDFLGTYQFESGESLLINLAPKYSNSGLYFFGQSLMVTHFGTGAVRALYPISRNNFLVGSARAIGVPFNEQITFQRDSGGNVRGLLWQTRDSVSGKLGKGQEATRLDLKSEAVHFTSEDGTNLTGLLTLPATPGPYPVMMMLHGSEPGTKDNFGNQQMAAFMASQGIAILNYDKRGAGESEGVYIESASEENLNRTAQDAIAGVEYLKGRAEIKANQIGLIGFSQAGWVIPVAASQSKDIAYFIILSGPITSVGHEDIYSTYTNDGESAEAYSQEEISKRLADTPHSGFDSTPIIAELDQPGLWIWGNQDKSLPWFESESNLKAMIDTGKSNFSYVVLPNADHNLQQTTQGLFNEIPYSSGFQAEYYKTIEEWLGENLK